MEITLEKIELVKDRTGVSYREAKEALEATEGNVVDAIIKIEDEINAKVGAKLSDSGAKIVEKIKEYIKKGHVSRITVKREEEIILNIPVTVGVVGTVLAPWLTVIGSITALGLHCEILLIKDDGTVVDLTAKLNDKFDDVVEKGSDAASAVRDKAADAIGKVKSRADKMADDAGDINDIVSGAAQDIKDVLTPDSDGSGEKDVSAKDE